MFRVTRNWRYKFQKYVHASVQIVALTFAIFGSYAVFHFHNEANIPNLYSLHSWLGITALVGFAGAWLAGFIAFLYPGLSAVYRRIVLPFHTYFGACNFVLCIGAAITGITEKAIFSL